VQKGCAACPQRRWSLYFWLYILFALCEGWTQQSDVPNHPAYIPMPLNPDAFNPSAYLPYGLQVAHLAAAMHGFLEFLGFINAQLNSRDMTRLELLLMPASFSSLVSEFMAESLPKYCETLVRNRYPNGHPDLIPKGMFPDDRVQYSQEGLEVKSSRYAGGWQGHNPERVWLMVFQFITGSVSDRRAADQARPFAFLGVYAAQLELDDWNYSGRSASSRRTITASVNASGMQKMRGNFVYRVSE
jgi:hypothetical protein